MGLWDTLSGLLGGDDGGDGAGEPSPPGGSPGQAGARPAEDEGSADSGGPGGGDRTDDVGEYGPDDFAAEAEEFADRHDDVPLDFGVGSLEALDEYAAGQGEIVGILGEEMDEDGFLTDLQGGYTLWLGSYFGEVLVRQLDGEWYREDGWTVTVPVDDGSLAVPVFDVAAESVADEPRFADLAADLREGLESAAAVEGGADDAGSPYAAEARELATFWSEYDLDFTPASLARLDDLVDAQWGSERFRDAELGGVVEEDRVFTGLVQQLGSYYGEVLVRHLGGEWIDHEDLGTSVEVRGAGEARVAATPPRHAAVANVFHVAADCLTEPSKFALSFDTVADQVDLDRDRISEGGQVVTADADEWAAVDADEAGAAAADEGAAAATDKRTGDDSLESEEIGARFREEAADLVEQWPGYDLDFTPASLERLDRLVTEEFAEFDFSDVALGAEGDGDSLFLTARAMETGGYLAEVFRRNLGGEWRDDDEIAFVVTGRDGEARLDPVGVGAAVFRGEDSFAATYRALRGRFSVPEREPPDSGDVPGTRDDPVEASDRDEWGDEVDDSDDVADQDEAGTPNAAGDPPRGTAEAFAAGHREFDLDFTPGSLVRLGTLVDGLSGSAAEEAAEAVAAYLGETIVRSYDAAWTRDEDAGWVVAATDADGEERTLVLPAVLEDCLDGEGSFAAAHDAFVDAVGLDGSTLDADEPDDWDEPNGSDEPEGPDPVIDRLSAKAAVDAAGEDLAREPAEDVGEDRRAAAEDLAEGWPAYDLDFSVESLVRLDSLVADHYDFSDGDREYEGDPLSVPEGTHLSIPTDGSVEGFAGYFAAVFERHHGAEWRRSDGGDVVLVVDGTAAAAELEPEMVAIACFAGQSSFVDAYSRVAADVGLEPPVGE